MGFDLSKKTLVIVESPTKANTIKKYLPSNFTVVASKGHIRDLPSDRLGIDVRNDFAPEYVVVENKNTLISDLKKKLAQSEQLLLATDEDREGESISWHLVKVLNPKVPYKRMVFHEITKNAIKEALNMGRDLDEKLIDAQEDRRIIDRLYGYEVSPVLWKRLSNKKLSAGRVQSVGLRLVVEKEMLRLNYQSSTYYDIEAVLIDEKNDRLFCKLESVNGKRIANGKDFNPETGKFNNNALILDGEAVKKLKKEAEENPFVVESVIQRPSVQHPYPPFTTSTLQQASNARLHFSTKETMRVAQSLFEQGFITYMRTDSTYLSKECIEASRAEILNKYGKTYLNPTVREFVTKSKNAQEAHEAIRPSGDVVREPEKTGLSGKELKLYTLIYQRTLATQMTSAQKSTMVIKLSNADSIYTSSETITIFPGFLKVYEQDRTDDEKSEAERLPSVSAGDELEKEKLEVKEHTTNPPNRYTEASLVKKLEELGIGRPSTYATIISTLLERGYVLSEKNTLIPTFLGFGTHNFLNTAFSPLIDFNYTSDMENQLDEIASGNRDRIEYLKNFYYGDSGLEALVKNAKLGKEDVKTLHIPSLSGSFDSESGKVDYSIKIGPFGAYIMTGLKDEKGKAILVNIPQSYTPGIISDDAVKTLVEALLLPKETSSDPNALVLKEGRYGKYWERGGKTVNVPRLKKDALSYTTEEIDFLFSLPKEIAQKDGKPITLYYGPYGPYFVFDGKNYKINSSVFEFDGKKALSMLENKDRKNNEVIKTFSDFQDKELRVLNGRYGLYLKWGDINCVIPKEYDALELNEEDARKIALSNADKKPKKRFRAKRDE